MNLLLTINDTSSLYQVVKTLLTHEVRAMQQNWDWLVESSAAFFLPNRYTMPTFQAVGMVQQQLYTCSNAGKREGHLLMTV